MAGKVLKRKSGVGVKFGAGKEVLPTVRPKNGKKRSKKRKASKRKGSSHR